LVFGAMAVLQKGATTVATVKMLPQEETTGKVTNGHATDRDLSPAEKSEIADASREPRVTYAPTDCLLIERWFARMPRSGRWIVAALGLVLLLIPAMLAYLDGVGIARLFADYRALFIYPVLIAYLLVACHLLQKTHESVAQALRPLMQLDEKTFTQAVERACRVSPRGELSALGVGMAMGLAINIVFEPMEPKPFLLELYSYPSRIVLWGAIGWAIFCAFAVTRLTNTLLRQPIRVEIFDLRPFQPIGRQSLWISVMFVGGMVLGLLSSNFAEEELRLEYLINNAVIIALIVAVFLVNTHNVHRVVAAMKKEQLESVEHHLARAYYRLEALIAENQDTYAVATELNALATSKQELKAIRTWPYNTEMLRTIFISIVTPLVVAIARVATVVLDSGRFTLP
jgi:hypothetical protein